MEAINQIIQGAADSAGELASSRMGDLKAVAPKTHARTVQLIELAKNGLPQMHDGGFFAHTVRKIDDRAQSGVRAEGDSLRYAANVALGLSYVDEETQHRVLGGRSAPDLAIQCAERAMSSSDAGAIALSAWTAAEAADHFASDLFDHLVALLESRQPIDTVDCSWTLIAAVAGAPLGDTRTLTRLTRDRLLKGQGPHGLFPHHLPQSASGRWRAHIGCFADQVYSTQGLSRLSMLTHDPEALAAANASGGAICRLQGPQGQWWWHYDTRNGTVVEGYPVYSVHQHAMGPMALLDLREAGGTDHMEAIAKGIDWLDGPNEAGQSLVCEANNVVWRKVARHEPKKLVRAISAATTAAAPGLKVPGLDSVFRPGRIDYECRPYELGWLLFAWLSDGMKGRLARTQPTGGERSA